MAETGGDRSHLAIKICFQLSWVPTFNIVPGVTGVSGRFYTNGGC